MIDESASPSPMGAPRPVGVEMMASLYQHRLLSTEQLRAMHCPHTSEQWGRQVLRELKNAGYVTSTNKRGGSRGEPMRLWFLTELGASTVELTPQGEGRRIIVSDAGAAGQLQAHTLAVNDVGIAFMNAARARDDICGALAWRHEVAHNIGGGAGRRGERVIADAVLEYTLSGEDEIGILYRFIELDRGTMTLGAVTQKLARYARLASYTEEPGQTATPLWRQFYPTLPAVLMVFAGRRRSELEQRMDVLASLTGADRAIGRSEIAVLFTLLEDLQAQGPFAPIFVRPDNPDILVDCLGRPGEGR
jgi:hypothetical protein